MSRLLDVLEEPVIETFSVGNKILIRVGSSWRDWRSGTIDKIDSEMLTCILDNGTPFLTSDLLSVRILDFKLNNNFEIISHHLKHHANAEMLAEICKEKELNLKIIGNKLILIAAEYGNWDAFVWLTMDNNVSILTTDDQGRNILQLAAANKHNIFTQNIVELCVKNDDLFSDFQMLVRQVDKDDRNLLHYIVTSNNESLLQYCVAGNNLLSKCLCEASGKMDRTAATYLTEKVDSMGQTPSDYADKFHYKNMKTMLALFSVQIIVHCFVVQYAATGTVLQFFNQIKNLKRSIADQEIDFNRIPMLQCTDQYFAVLAYKIALESIAPVMGFKWLANECRINLSQLQLPNDKHFVQEFESNIMEQVIVGPKHIYFDERRILPLLTEKNSDGTDITMSQLSAALRPCLYQLYENWSPEHDAITHLITKRAGTSSNKLFLDKFKFRYLKSSESWVGLPPNLSKLPEIDSIVVSFIEQALQIMRDDQVEDRLDNFDYLRLECGMAVPSLHLFVLSGQHRLLNYVCERSLVVLTVPLSSDVAVAAYASTLSWLTAEDISVLSLVDFLRALAVTVDELLVFQELYKHNLPVETIRVGEHKLNLAHLAAQHNSFLIMKQIVSMNFVDLTETYHNTGMNVAHIAAKNGFVQLALFLITKVDPLTADRRKRTVVDHALKSGDNYDKRLFVWAKELHEKVQFVQTIPILQTSNDPTVWIAQLKKMSFAQKIKDSLSQYNDNAQQRRNGMFCARGYLHIHDDGVNMLQSLETPVFFLQNYVLYCILHGPYNEVMVYFRDEMDRLMMQPGNTKIHEDGTFQHLYRLMLAGCHEENNHNAGAFLQTWVQARNEMARSRNKEIIKLVEQFIHLLRHKSTYKQLQSNYEAQTKLLKGNYVAGDCYYGSAVDFYHGETVDPSSPKPFDVLLNALTNDYDDNVRWVLTYRKHDTELFCTSLRICVKGNYFRQLKLCIELGYKMYTADQMKSFICRAMALAVFGPGKLLADRLDIVDFLVDLAIKHDIDICDDLPASDSGGAGVVSNLFNYAMVSYFMTYSAELQKILDKLFTVPSFRNKVVCITTADDMPLVVKLSMNLLDKMTTLDRPGAKIPSDVPKYMDKEMKKFKKLLKDFLTAGLVVRAHEAVIIDMLYNDQDNNGDFRMLAIVNLLQFFALTYGFSIQPINITSANFRTRKDPYGALSLLVEEIRCQNNRITMFSSLKNIELNSFAGSMQNGSYASEYKCLTAKYDRGRTLLHGAALYNRPEICAYLIQKFRFNVMDRDGDGYTSVQLAKAAGSTEAQQYLEHYLLCRMKISRFCCRHFSSFVRSAVHQRKKCLRAVRVIQRGFRLYVVRKAFIWKCENRVDPAAGFLALWSPVVTLLRNCSTANTLSWAMYKQKYDLNISNGSHVSTSTDSYDANDIDAAVQSVIDLDETAENLTLDCDSAATSIDLVGSNTPVVSLSSVDVSKSAVEARPSDNIELTQSVVKWLERAEPRFRTIFQSRMERLAAGDRTYLMCKRLQHCGQYPIYETKLDAGQRILWTAVRRGIISNILVWFVCKHDFVSRLADCIVRANARSSSAAALAVSTTTDQLELGDENVLLDPTCNCPLKIYTASRGDIPLLTATGWSPALRLDNKQHDACSNSGTTLLLGRSGTGKTVCLSDRMTRDRLMYAINSQQCNQLFVSRSRRLCELVKHFQHNSAASETDLQNASFLTLAQFVSQMDNVITSEVGPSDNTFEPIKNVDFQRFSVLMSDVIAKSGLSALVIWIQIRSFLKGSLEAVMHVINGGKCISREQFVGNALFSSERCRLNSEQRDLVYTVYEQYQHILAKDGLWDDADNVLDLLTRSKLQPLSACSGKGADYHKVYVDEVQDNTQAEIVLYFLAGGMNTQSLFLAGDPAQSVVEGVDFRFEEVRGIVHSLSNGTQQIARASKLAVNYRSHRGILDSAAAVLDKLFTLFPGSAKVLPRDAGLFNGPRPAFEVSCALSRLVAILQEDESMVVLCHDSVVSDVKVSLSNTCGSAMVNNTVLGIRAAKGLEFKSIVLFDFFSQLPECDHKAWISVLRCETSDGGIALKYPQVELQLKLLYTGITRCCEKLLFVESKTTRVFTVFCGWLQTKQLAERFNLSEGSAAVLMTADEWRVRGIEFSLSAEGNEAERYLSQAVQCFEIAGDKVLVTHATVQIELYHFHRRILNGEVLLCKDGNLHSSEELNAVNIVLRGVKHQFLTEVSDICKCIAPLMKERNLFEQHVLSVLLTHV